MLLASYRRLNNSGEGQNNTVKDFPGTLNLPLIRASVAALGASVARVKIDFSDMSDSLKQYPKVTVLNSGGSTTFEILATRRSVAALSLTEFKRFTEFETADITASNSDVTAQVDADIGNSVAVWVACFAASWGFDPSTISIVYSIPVLLGYEAVLFPHL
jgi:hypothetical protein